MNFYDDQSTTTGELFEQFFPGREDVIRLLMEPITYANGSTLEDPAISYGIVFSNFMSKGVFTFEGGTDRLINLMEQELRKSGVDIRINCDVEQNRLHRRPRPRRRQSTAARFAAGAVVSNANLKRRSSTSSARNSSTTTFVDDARAVRLNNSSTQVYMALKPDDHIDESTGDLLFSSTAPLFRTDLLLSRDITSRTYSFYYPRTRPEGKPRCLIVSSTNARYEDWAEPERRGIRSQQERPHRNDARRPRQVRAQRPRADRPRRGLDAASRSSITRSTSTARASARSSKASPSAAPSRNKSPACTTPAASASSCPAGSAR